jgi:uncharacterized OB-fold protein
MGIISKVTKNIEGKAHYHKFPVWYEYTVGVAGEIFAKNLKEQGLLTGAKCPCCGKVYLPPRVYCEECFEEIKEFLALEPVGVVETYCEVYEDIDGNRFDKPKVVAFVRIDGSCGGLFGFIEGGVQMGDKVKAQLVEKRKRTGTVSDIVCFKKVG